TFLSATANEDYVSDRDCRRGSCPQLASLARGPYPWGRALAAPSPASCVTRSARSASRVLGFRGSRTTRSPVPPAAGSRAPALWRDEKLGEQSAVGAGDDHADLDLHDSGLRMFPLCPGESISLMGDGHGLRYARFSPALAYLIPAAVSGLSSGRRWRTR